MLVEVSAKAFHLVDWRNGFVASFEGSFATVQKREGTSLGEGRLRVEVDSIGLEG